MSAHSEGMKTIRATADAATVTKVQDLLTKGAFWVFGDDEHEVGLVYSGKVAVIAWNPPLPLEPDHEIIDDSLFA